MQVRGLDRSGRDDVDADFFGGIFFGEGAGEAEDGVFGGALFVCVGGVPTDER